MTKFNLFALSFLFLPLMSVAAICPLGPKEDHLTVNRVMRNFGYIMYADDICLQAKTPWQKEAIQDKAIQDAIEKLDIVVACADQVLNDPTGDVLPNRISLIKDEAQKQELIDDYIYFMTDFKDAVAAYRDAFQRILAQTPADRNYDEANEKRNDVNVLVDRAHSKL